MNHGTGWRQAFSTHPSTTGESYGQHLWFTITMAARFAQVGAILVAHGLLPFLFTHTASRRITAINTIMQQRSAKANGLQATLGNPSYYLSEGI